jgi:MFS family permease|tara:strand:+ start:319 stop:759 length:441 start_codon:yes stop_codon:yes gene_type:complete
MQFGLALASTGPIVPALRYQLNWGNEREVFDFNVTILSTSALVGIALGNIFGGDFVKNGRRKTIIIFNILGAIATCFTLILDFNSMCFGRMLFGFASGILSCATPKVLDETIPANLMDKGFGTSTNIIINFAFFAVLIMAMGMPET